MNKQEVYAEIGGETFMLKDDEAGEKLRKATEVNTDPYGARCVSYAKEWALLMQRRIGGGKARVHEVAKQASHDADYDGITGFMYGMAVRILSECWKWGEELRQWHNGEFGESAGRSHSIKATSS